jgi:hypothetical protein
MKSDREVTAIQGSRSALISALTACSDARLQAKARHFLCGLSSDELQYIAEFLGACVLETPGHRPGSRRELAEGITHFARCRGQCMAPPSEPLNDQEHKMILLLEYLCVCELAHMAVVQPAQRTR